MKVLVDSSVWIDFFRGQQTDQTAKLEQMILQREDLCLCGFVWTEVLQGFQIQSEYLQAKATFPRSQAQLGNVLAGKVALCGESRGQGAT